MAKFAHASSLIRSEQQAQRDYARSARQSSPAVAKTLRHIGREEAGHERELKAARKR